MKKKRRQPEEFESDNTENSDPNSSESKGFNSSSTIEASKANSEVDRTQNQRSIYYSRQELMNAAANGNLSLIQKMLQPQLNLTVAPKDDDISSKLPNDNNKNTNKKASTFFSNMLGCALLRSCESGHGSVSHTLLELGANIFAIDAKDVKQQSSLHKAAGHGDAELVKMLLAKEPDALDKYDKV